jgi:hypothetical protein
MGITCQRPSAWEDRRIGDGPARTWTDHDCADASVVPRRTAEETALAIPLIRCRRLNGALASGLAHATGLRSFPANTEFATGQAAPARCGLRGLSRAPAIQTQFTQPRTLDSTG